MTEEEFKNLSEPATPHLTKVKKELLDEYLSAFEKLHPRFGGGFYMFTMFPYNKETQDIPREPPSLDEIASELATINIGNAGTVLITSDSLAALIHLLRGRNVNDVYDWWHRKHERHINQEVSCES